jgi:hypothetical protein
MTRIFEFMHTTFGEYIYTVGNVKDESLIYNSYWIIQQKGAIKSSQNFAAHRVYKTKKKGNSSGKATCIQQIQDLNLGFSSEYLG